VLPSGRTSGTRISQILAGSALRVLAPLDGFGRAPRAATFRDGLRRLAPSRPVKPPTLRGLVSCRSRPWSSPLQSFPFPGSRARSRRPRASLRVRCPTAPGAVLADPSRPLSSFAPALSSQDDGSPRSLVRSPRPAFRRIARSVRSLPALGSPYDGRHARFEALLPPGVRSATTLALARRESRSRCSHGVLALQSSLHYGPGPVSRVDARAELEAPATYASRNPAVAVAFPRSGLRPRAREPRIRRYARL